MLSGKKHWTVAFGEFAMIGIGHQESREVVMASQVVNLQVTASIPIECEFWPEDDGWKRLSRSPLATVRGSSFEDAKI